MPLRILIVDDNQDAADLLGELLGEFSHQVVVVHDSKSALDLAAQAEFDVLILDIGLPRIDGWDLARKIRELPKNRSARVIAVSGYGREADRQRSRDAGFDAHFVKPVGIEELLSLLKVETKGGDL